jgi:transcription antitermination factor NusG
MLYNWYAVYTNPRAEKKINERLLKKNIEAFLPLQKKLHQWKDRKKLVEVPLINSYLFVKVSEKEYYDVLNTPGIVRYITFSGKAAPIPEWQIAAMKQLLESNHDFEVTTEEFQKGDLVKVVSGALTGMQGELVSFKSEKKVLIRIEHINHCLIVNIPISHLKPIN